jgi:hypothetical protein
MEDKEFNEEENPREDDRYEFKAPDDEVPFHIPRD